MDNIEPSLNKAFLNPPKTLDIHDRIQEELEKAVAQTSLRVVVKILADIAQSNHEHQLYMEWEKDARALSWIADQIRN